MLCDQFALHINALLDRFAALGQRWRGSFWGMDVKLQLLCNGLSFQQQFVKLDTDHPFDLLGIP